MAKLPPDLVQFLFEGMQSVPIKGHDGRRAVMIRVYYPGGWFTEHEVGPEREPTR